MAALVEMYGSPTQLAGLEATLEILATEDAAPLAIVVMRIVAGPAKLDRLARQPLTAN